MRDSLKSMDYCSASVNYRPNIINPGNFVSVAVSWRVYHLQVRAVERDK